MLFKRCFKSDIKSELIIDGATIIKIHPHTLEKFKLKKNLIVLINSKVNIIFQMFYDFILSISFLSTAVLTDKSGVTFKYILN